MDVWTGTLGLWSYRGHSGPTGGQAGALQFLPLPSPVAPQFLPTQHWEPRRRLHPVQSRGPSWYLKQCQNLFRNKTLLIKQLPGCQGHLLDQQCKACTGVEEGKVFFSSDSKEQHPSRQWQSLLLSASETPLRYILNNLACPSQKG